MVSKKDLFKFMFGFVGLVSLGLSVLVTIGFYQVEVAGKKNLSATGAAIPFGQTH